jgi:hypothetical protein|tara:strand:+ start:8400 stop:9269 length:870 start_codon:yes stop_codon:yes gene_type:complete
MRIKKNKHNKIRNTGLLFEFLLRQVTVDVLNKEKDSHALELIKKSFNENTNLGKELALYNILINEKLNSDRKADFLILEVIKERNKINKSKLRREKYNLIKEVGNKYDLQKLFSSKIKNYKVFASIFKLLEYHDNLSPSDKTESYFNIVEHITTKNVKDSLTKTVPSIATLSKDQDLRIIAYRILLEKFNKKYLHLNKEQKDLLKEYINNISNTNSLKEYIEIRVPQIKSKLKKHVKIVDDKITRIKLNEAINSIDKFCDIGSSKIVKDSVVIQMLRYFELLKALKKHV